MPSKRSLRSSRDIFHRLKWSGAYPLERIRIGYADRHEGMMEIPFGKFRPGGNIPWDRVWYFVLDGNRLWDRKSRIDHVFGSGDTLPEKEKPTIEPMSFEGLVLCWDRAVSDWKPFVAGKENHRLDRFSIAISRDNRLNDDRLEADFIYLPAWETQNSLTELLARENASEYGIFQSSSGALFLTKHSPTAIKVAETGWSLSFLFNGKILQIQSADFSAGNGGQEQAQVLIGNANLKLPGFLNLKERLEPEAATSTDWAVYYADQPERLVPWKIVDQGSGDLKAEFRLQVNYRMLAEAGTVHQSALCYIPPMGDWAPIQAIRRTLDPQFARWMPHISLLYGFIPDPLFPAAAAALKLLLEEWTAFPIRFEELGHFDHRHSTVLWLRPDEEAETRLRALKNELQELFPQCSEQDRHGEFRPHLTIAKVHGHWNAMQVKSELEADWEALNTSVGAICLISRRGNGPFVVREVISLGGENAENYNLRKQDLETSLGALGLLPGAGERSLREKAREQFQTWLRAIDPKILVYTVGSAALGIDGLASDLDLLAVGRAERAVLWKEMKSHGALEVGEVLRMEWEGLKVELRYVAYPAGMEMRRPSHLKTDDFQAFSVQDQAVLATSYEVAALYRHLDASLLVFRIARQALRWWVHARELDLPEWGFPPGIAWTLMLAGTDSEESPGLWLERMYERLAHFDWREPLTVREGLFPAFAEAPMQVITLAYPHRNTTAKLSRGLLQILQAEFQQGLETVWSILYGGRAWGELFRPIARPQHPVLRLYLQGEPGPGQYPAIHWIQESLVGLLLEIEGLGPEFCRPRRSMEGVDALENWSLELAIDPVRLKPLLIAFRQAFHMAFPHSEFDLRWQYP